MQKRAKNKVFDLYIQFGMSDWFDIAYFDSAKQY